MVLGLGDSTVEGPGDAALDCLPRSWPWWLARGLDLPYHDLSWPGATAPEVARELLPRARFGYSLACVGLGINDVRLPSWDAGAFREALGAVLAGLRTERAIVATVPLDLGRPRAGAKVEQLNAVIRELAPLVVELEDLRGWRAVMPDAVHPTAYGHVLIADRAAQALGIAVRPSSLAEPDLRPRSVARYALTRHVPMAGRDLKRRARELPARLRPFRGGSSERPERSR